MTKIAVFDIDGTVHREGMSFIVAEDLLAGPDFKEEAKILAAATHTYKSRGSTEAYWTYNKTILDVFKKALRHTTPEQLDRVIATLLKYKSDYCYAYTMQLIKQLKAEGRILIAISGSIANIVEPFARSLGFDYIVASGLEIKDGKFTGERITETKQGKDKILRELVTKHGLILEDSIGVGDTHRDIPMLSVTEHPIAFNPNAALYEEAEKHGWKIVLERKNMIYELEKNGKAYAGTNIRPIFDDNHQEHLR
ncbi:MAG TPA: HAD family phosphatase [Candidatus Saccharimonadales bacterium]